MLLALEPLAVSERPRLQSRSLRGAANVSDVLRNQFLCVKTPRRASNLPLATFTASAMGQKSVVQKRLERPPRTLGAVTGVASGILTRLS